jgi:CubicO group peptidase (beta-lactamase class C family)
MYWQWSTWGGEKVFSGEVEGKTNSWEYDDSTVWLASASKLYTAFAAMYTFELKPDRIKPETYLHEFPGWEGFRDFPIAGTDKTANLQLHHLLTHTSGIPFSMNVGKDDIYNMKLFYEPGTAFGYTIGHRIMGWLLRDFWSQQPEASGANIQSVNDCFKWLYWDQMGLTQTSFTNDLSHFFAGSSDYNPPNEAGDAAIQSSGDDFMTLAIVALRKGTLPDGTRFISEENWDKWAVPNLLPDGKLTADLVDWQSGQAQYRDNNMLDWKAMVMKQSGAYGWNYFGATYYGFGAGPWAGQNGMPEFKAGSGYTNTKPAPEIGWCGFFSSCLHVSYTKNKIAFVMMQRDVADLKKSKPYMQSFFQSMASSLMCYGGGDNSCFMEGQPSVQCQNSYNSGDTWTSPAGGGCPYQVQAAKDAPPFASVGNEVPLDPSYRYQCYLSQCDNAFSGPSTPIQPGGSRLPDAGSIPFCDTNTGGTCGYFSCSSYRNANCVGSWGNALCMCSAGQCAYNGRCISSEACPKATPGTCANVDCYSSRGPTNCVHDQCVCQYDACSYDGVCQERCGKITDGTCHFFGCNSDRQASCDGGRCVCGGGQCTAIFQHITGARYSVCRQGGYNTGFTLATNFTARIIEAKKAPSEQFRPIQLWESLLGRLPDLENIYSHPAVSGCVAFSTAVVAFSVGFMVRVLRQRGESQLVAPLLEGSQ